MPHLASTEGKSIAAVQLKQIGKAARNEAWLQQLLHENPSLIPVSAIDDRVQEPLFSIGREVPTPVGRIDNLFISANGYLVVGETKLWRNPEARRKVVAQILDYATRVRSWTYDTLQNCLRNCQGNQSANLWANVKPGDEPEDEWIESVNDNLQNGRMVLLIIGDRIRTEARQLVEFLETRSDLTSLFRVGLLEMSMYEMKETGQTLVVPVTIARTQEIERSVIRIVYESSSRPKVVVGMAPGENKARRQVLSEEALLGEIRRNGVNGEVNAQAVERLLELAESQFSVEWKSRSFTIKAAEPSGSGEMLSMGVVYGTGQFVSFFPWLEGQLKRAWGDAALARSVREKYATMFDAFSPKYKKTGDHVDAVELPIDSWRGKEESLLQQISGMYKVIQDEALKRAN